jgi:hypothetical protein
MSRRNAFASAFCVFAAGFAGRFNAGRPRFRGKNADLNYLFV